MTLEAGTNYKEVVEKVDDELEYKFIKFLGISALFVLAG